MPIIIYSLLFSLSASTNIFFYSPLKSFNQYLIAENFYYSFYLKSHLTLKGNWILEEGVYKNEKILATKDKPIKISFHDKHITGFAVFNDYFATFEEKPSQEIIKQNKDKIPVKISKEIFISKEIDDIKLMNISSNYLRALQNIEYYYFKGNNLILAGKDIELKFKPNR